MACGDIAWWRAPDFVGLLQRHGQIEHLIIQFDFLVQLDRDPRAEFSIPGASKSVPGRVGFADIVSVAGKQIWEVKPKHLEELAAKEATHYLKFAEAGCGGGWELGNSYHVSDFTKSLYGAENILYRAEAPGLRYELIGEQGVAGTALYHWRLNGNPIGALDAAWSWAVRGKIMMDYFGKQVPAPIKGSKPPPNDIPPIKFKPPVLVPDGCIPLLKRGLVAINKAIVTTCAGRIVDGGGVAVLLEETAYSAIVGPSNVARTVQNLQVTADPQVVFARALYVALSASASAFGVPYAAWMLWEAGVAVICALTEGGTAAAPAAIPAAGTAGSRALGAELLSLFATAVRGMKFRSVVAGGTTWLVVAIPRVSQAAPGKPAAVDLFPFKFQILKPREMAGARIGQMMKLQGTEHYIVALAQTPGD